jgi:hypothetical protein
MNKWKENCKQGKNQITLNVTKLIGYKQDKMLEERVCRTKLNEIVYHLMITNHLHNKCAEVYKIRVQIRFVLNLRL